MARAIGNRIPAPLRPVLAGDDLASREGITFLVLTATPDGWPHLAMVSVGELLATGPRDARLALWAASTAAANLAASGRTTLAVVHQGVAYYLRCSARRLAELRVGRADPLIAFALHVEEAFEDVAPYADLTSGVTFRLKEPSTVLPVWRRTIAALREAPGREEP